MKKPTRPQKVAQRILEVLTEALRHEVNDPHLKGVVLTHAEVSRDLSFAKIYFMLAEDTAALDLVLKGFDRATGFFRSKIAASIELRIVPGLKFHLDDSLQRAERIRQLLENVE